MKPINNYVLVRRDPAQTRTDGGIYLPTTEKNRSTSGEVTEVGPTVPSTSGLKKGVRVRYSERVGVEMDEDFLVLKDTDILCVE